MKSGRPERGTLPGGGPWMILESCPARTHNTMHASRAGRAGQTRCVCPRSVHFNELKKKADREQKRGQARARNRLRIPAPVEVARPLVYPDFLGGLCTTPAGMRIADAAQSDKATIAGIQAREIAKALCGPCPHRAKCLDWIIREEGSVPGALGGVWGGRDPWNRRGKTMVIVKGRVELVPYVVH